MTTNPFPGLRPFKAEDSRFFMGREVASSVALTRVRVSPVTVMFARSGVGKSSFLICRLIPLLEKDSNTEYVNEWGSCPPHQLVENAVRRLLSLEERQEKPVLILDQFEDVFKFPSQRERLWDCLANYVNVDFPRVTLLISMREEWLGAWEEVTNYIPDTRVSLFRLAPLSDREIIKAIKKPVELEGSVVISQALVDTLTVDLKRPNAFGMGDVWIEPGILQLVCSRLWDDAAASGEKSMNERLYHKLGQADAIVRRYVWDSLGSARSKGSDFSSSDRILWVGLTRHLILAQGVKAIVDPISLAKKLRVEDLGVAGEATAVKVPTKEGNTFSALGYLHKRPEKREEPPRELVFWITSVLVKGVNAGFLKKQRAVKSVNSEQGNMLYELSHDFLSSIFQQFTVEFEGWLRARLAKLVGLLVGTLVFLPLAVVQFVRNEYDVYETLKDILFGFGVLLFYGIVIVVFTYIGKLLNRVLIYPVIRWLAKGEVPFTKGADTQTP